MSLRSIPGFNPFHQPHFLYEYLSRLDYPSIRGLCGTETKIESLCRTDPKIKNLINKKRIQHKVEYLLSQSDPQNVLYYAVIYGDVDTVDELLKRGVDPNFSIIEHEGTLELSLFKWALRSGHVSVIDRLLQDDRIDPTVDDNSAIRNAIVDGNLDIMKSLFRNPKVKKSFSVNEAISIASYNGKIDVLNDLLQDPIVDPGANNNDAIKWAAVGGKINVVNRLLQDSRVDPTADNNYSIMWAASLPHSDVVRRLLQDIRIRQSLSPERLEYYKRQIGDSILPPLINPFQSPRKPLPRSNRALPPVPSRR